MIARVIVRRRAQQDIRETRQWYLRISARLSDDFLAAVEDAITLARERPFAFAVVHRTFRRILLRRFPYALIYHADDRRLVVVGVLHQARDPQLLEERE
jgi:plasmid stabilization system protein ParE